MRPYGSRKTLERRRRRAVALLAQGLSLSGVTRRVQASTRSVYQWRQAWRTRGEAALALKLVPGRRRQLTDQPRVQLLQLLRHGARAHGFPHELWSLRRMAAVIPVHFGVRYHPSHVWKVLRRSGWSRQGSERLGTQRDERAMAHGKRDQLGTHRAFLDASGLPLMPTRRRTWAPEGQTPIVPYHCGNDRLSALAALTVSPNRQPMGSYVRFQASNFRVSQTPWQLMVQ